MITNTNAGNHPSTVRGGFDSNAYEDVEEALSQPEMQENIQGRDIKPTSLQSLQNLLRQKEDANSWTSPPILIYVAESLDSNTIIQIDIAETLVGRDKGRNVPSPEKRNDDNCYWFSKIVDSNDEKFREEKIIPEIKAACRRAGFTVNCKYKKMENDNGCIEVKCFRATYFSEEKSTAHNEKKKRTSKSNTAPKKNRKKTSMKPIHGQDGNDMRCPFHFQIYWDQKRQRWFLPKIQRGIRMHCGHNYIEPAGITLEAKNSISAMEEEIAKDSLGSHTSTKLNNTTSSTFSHSQNGLTFGGKPSTNSGATKMVHHASTFAVPSQSFRDDNRNESEMHIGDSEDVNNDQVNDSDETDLVSKFHARYETLCKYAESAGDMGIGVMTRHFNHCHLRFLNFFNNSTVTDNHFAAPDPPKSGSTAYVRFKNPYETICRMAQQSGKAGVNVVNEELQACQQELVILVEGKKLSTKKSDSRRRKVTSPQGKSSRKRLDEWPL